MAIAKYSGQCKAAHCRKESRTIHEGDRVLFLNRPAPRSTFHPECVGKAPAPDWTTVEPLDPYVPPTLYLVEPPVTPEPAPEPTPVAKRTGDALLDIITDAVSQRIIDARLTDETKVREIARDEIASFGDMLQTNLADRIEKVLATLAPRVIELHRPDAPVVTIEGAHWLMPRVAALLEAGIHVYLWGEPGTGKTTVLMQLAKALGRYWEVDTLDPSTSRASILGYKQLKDDSPSETAFTRCYQHEKGLYIGEEADLSPAQVQSIKNTALANGHCGAGWGQINRGESFVYAGNGNTPGRPTKSFPERKNMSEAFKDRLYFVEWPLDPNIERRATGRPLVKVPEREVFTCSVSQWGEWVENTRAYCKANAPEIKVSPRATFQGKLALSIGETPLEAAHGLVFRGADSALTGKVLAACPIPRSK